MKKLIYKFANNDQEMEGIRAVRRQVFVEEQGITEDLVFEGDGRDDEMDVAALEEESVVGTVRVVFLTKDTVKIERMAVLESSRNKGVGKGIINFLDIQFKHRKVKSIVLHAQHSAVRFYKSCGFTESGPFFFEAGIKHIKMELRY
jgi:predicted GNAT family N-acyltransferase